MILYLSMQKREIPEDIAKVWEREAKVLWQRKPEKKQDVEKKENIPEKKETEKIEKEKKTSGFLKKFKEKIGKQLEKKEKQKQELQPDEDKVQQEKIAKAIDETKIITNEQDRIVSIVNKLEKVRMSELAKKLNIAPDKIENISIDLARKKLIDLYNKPHEEYELRKRKQNN